MWWGHLLGPRSSAPAKEASPANHRHQFAPLGTFHLMHEASGNIVPCLIPHILSIFKDTAVCTSIAAATISECLENVAHPPPRSESSSPAMQTKPVPQDGHLLRGGTQFSIMERLCLLE